MGKGGERHQKKVEEVAQNLKKRGFKIVYEYFISRSIYKNNTFVFFYYAVYQA